MVAGPDTMVMRLFGGLAVIVVMMIMPVVVMAVMVVAMLITVVMGMPIGLIVTVQGVVVWHDRQSSALPL